MSAASRPLRYFPPASSLPSLLLALASFPALPHAPQLARLPTSILPRDTQHCSVICGQPDLALAVGGPGDRGLGQARVWI